ncbi:MAG: tRNA (N(6)-L-threonylcarbamoyladenosine(37)-C(2))-methylthiotransferase MtaB [Peptostreptococcaceae bacterium]|nr:tRNA (N(6)-L-threonylcarbamoyladenosine(37)-C(2))-methylthiotransferase MtaB [Peptostreptococcaceae bacterium]
MKIRFLIETLGCKVNQYESEALREALIREGYEEAGHGQIPDLAIFNTCGVTHLAERKSRQAIRKYARMVPKPQIVVLGCYPQIFENDIKKIDGVDIVMGACDKGRLIDLLKKEETGSFINPIDEGEPYDDLCLEDNNEKTRAFIKIQDGCDNFCSYCIIPYTRGRTRSRALESILKEAELLARRGYKEVVLIGIQSAFYGRDLERDIELVDVVESVAGIKGIERVRLGSAEPTYFTTERLDRLSGICEFCPHFHLSLQSGSDIVLKAMNRKYTTGRYSEIINDIKTKFDNPSVTTDLIVGFPGETDEDIEETLSFIRKMAFKDVHVFRYSKRKGTAAAKMQNHVNPFIAKKRSISAIACASECAKNFMESQVGRVEDILFETVSESEMWEGHSMNFTKVRTKSKETLSGRIRQVRLISMEKDTIWGEIV